MAATPEITNPDTGQSDQPSLGEIGLSSFVPYLLNRIASSWNMEIQDTLRKQNLNTVRMRALAVLTVKNGLSIKELIHLTVIEQSTLSRALDALEKLEMIERIASKDDRRVRTIYITDKGRDAFSNVWPDMFFEYNDMFAGIDDTERARLVQTLHKILNNLGVKDPGS
ncbi:MarR family winged helix-turn-helix transcriptional regulator [Shimia sediminis]|uniref:MarR family winged helix-turn-helix transcriptional regulator n=1 Tax=Shimia sediminis TaxID=2497945 RepID=UPI000F8DEF9B|nr:MarR family winged helix-turn-helix transcriptional regulator [Shimia sediminis]